jgi:hypothetical protein
VTFTQRRLAPAVSERPNALEDCDVPVPASVTEDAPLSDRLVGMTKLLLIGIACAALLVLALGGWTVRGVRGVLRPA